MTKTAKKQMAEKADLRALSKAEILARCAPVVSRIVPVAGWGAGVEMTNISFPEFSKILVDAADDHDAKIAMIVAAVCKDLDLKDAYALQRGNGLQFAPLLQAVNEFLDFKITEEKVKN